MMTLFDVAMFEASPDFVLRPAALPEPGPMRRAKYMILLCFPAMPATGAKENAPPPPAGQHEAPGL